MNARPDTESAAPSRQGGIYHGWLVVGAAFLVALFGFGIGFYGPGIYLVALQERHGWSGADIASAITVYYLIGATLVFAAGRIFERFGPRLVVMTGAIAMAGGVGLITLIAHPWQVYAAFSVMALGWAAMSGAAVAIMIAPWFDKRRGLAVSLALNGASAGGVVIAPLLLFLIQRLGFVAALSAAAGLMLAVVLPAAALVLRGRRPGERDRQDGGPPQQSHAGMPDEPPWPLSAVLRSASFQTISVPFALGLLAQVGFLTHQVAYLAPLLGHIAAGWAVSPSLDDAPKHLGNHAGIALCAPILIEIKASRRLSRHEDRRWQSRGTRAKLGLAYRFAMIICSCNVLSDNDVRLVLAAAPAPLRTTAQVWDGLGRSAQCGRCTRSIRRIIGTASECGSACCRSADTDATG